MKLMNGLKNTKGHSPLELLVLKHHKNTEEASKRLGVTAQAFRSWYHAAPSNFLKYVREYREMTGASYEEITQAVTDAERYLTQCNTN
jgi:hypothetical protein